MGLNNDKPLLNYIMAWHQAANDKLIPYYKSVTACSQTHICIARSLICSDIFDSKLYVSMTMTTLVIHGAIAVYGFRLKCISNSNLANSHLPNTLSEWFINRDVTKIIRCF